VWDITSGIPVVVDVVEAVLVLEMLEMLLVLVDSTLATPPPTATGRSRSPIPI